MPSRPATSSVRAAARPAAAGLPRVGIVLAAGRSERLQAVTGGRSKALVRLGGVPLVERAVRGLLAAGVEEVVVVVGYEAGPVAAIVKRIPGGRVRAVHAKNWNLGNGASLAAAEKVIGASDDVFAVVTMDHLFSPNALDPLLGAGRPAVLVDRAPRSDVWAEGTRVRLRRGAAVAFSKSIDTPIVDCGAFLLPREIFACLRRAGAAGDYSLAAGVTELARERPLQPIELPPNAWWQDVDTTADLKIARRRLRHSLTKPNDGPVSRHLNRPISTRLSVLLAPLGVSPDVLSILSATAGLLGAGLLGRGAAVVGALVVHASSVLDGVDGEVARLRLRARPVGALLDGVLDRLVDAAIIGGLGVWALDSGAGGPHVVVLTVAAAAGAMLSMASKDRILAVGLVGPPEFALGWLFGGRDGRLLLVAVFALLGRPSWALMAIAASSLLTLGLRVGVVIARNR